jgi:hypothetical protein
MATAITPILPTWLEGIPDLSASITLMRVSSNSTEKLASNADANAGNMSHLPSIQRLTDAGGLDKLLDGSSTGKTERLQLGVVDIERRHAHAGGDCLGRVMGYLWAMEDCKEILVLLHDSAADDNIWSDDDPLPKNAVAELMVQLAMHPKIGRVNVPELSRLVRSDSHGPRVLEALRRGECDLYRGERKEDLHSPGGRVVASVNVTTNANERDAICVRMTRGAIGKLTRNNMGWPLAASTVPPGYQIGNDTGDQGEGHSRRSETVCPDAKHVEGWTEFFKAIADGSSYRDAGAILAKHKIPCRGSIDAGKTYASYNSTQLTGVAINLSQFKYYTMLREYKYALERKVPVSVGGATTFEGHPISPGVDLKKHPYGVVKISIDLPKHGIILSEEEWNAWEKRLKTRASREAVSDEPRHALIGMSQWREGDHDYKICSSGGNPFAYYQVRRRAIDKSVDKRGLEKGWDTGEGELVHSALMSNADMAFGKAIEVGAIEILDRAAVLSLIRRNGSDDPVAIAFRQTRLIEIEHEIENSIDDVLGIRLLVESDPTDRRRQKLEIAESILASLTAEREGLVALVTDSDNASRGRSEVEGDVEVDIGSLASIAGLLQGAPGKMMPRDVNDTLRKITAGTLRIESSSESPNVGLIRATIHWPSTDGEILTFDICQAVTLARRAGSKGETGYAAAQLILAQGKTVDETVAMFGGPRTRRSVLLSAMKWLSANGVTNYGMRRSLLDCPVPRTKAVLWSLLTKAPLPESTDTQFAELLKQTYLTGDAMSGRQGTWARNVDLERKVLFAISAWGARGQDIAFGITADELARQIKCRPAEIFRLAGCQSDRKYSTILEHHAGDERVLLPRRCTKCNDWLLHVLRTPETMESDGLICFNCCALPSGIELPEEYLALWDGMRPAKHIFDAPGSYLRKKSDYQTEGQHSGQQRLMRSGEASRELGIPKGRLTKWSDLGDIACDRKGKGEARNFDPAALAAKAKAVTASCVPGMLTSDEIPYGYIALYAAAPEINVGYWNLRELALSTAWDKGPMRYRIRGAGRRATYVVSEADLASLDPSWLDSCSADRFLISAASVYAGLPQSVIRGAANRGDLKCAITGQTRRFLPAELDAWLAGPGRIYKMLSPREAAKSAGVHVDALRRAVEKGNLSGEQTLGGLTRFDPAVVLAWAASK